MHHIQSQIYCGNKNVPFQSLSALLCDSLKQCCSFSESCGDSFFSFLPTASLGVRWMIGQTEIKRASNYGNKEVSLNNNQCILEMASFYCRATNLQTAVRKNLCQNSPARLPFASADLLQCKRRQDSFTLTLCCGRLGTW